VKIPVISSKIEVLEPRRLCSVTIATPPGPNSIELQDTGGALVVSIDGRATYRLHSGVTILASGNDQVILDGLIAEPVTVTTGANDTTLILEETDNQLTLDGPGSVTLNITNETPPPVIWKDAGTRLPASFRPRGAFSPSPAPSIIRRGLLKQSPDPDAPGGGE